MTRSRRAQTRRADLPARDLQASARPPIPANGRVFRPVWLLAPVVAVAMVGTGLGAAVTPARAASTGRTGRAVAQTSPTDPQDGNYVPLPQATLIDTRSGVGLPHAQLTGGTTYNVQVAG